MMSRLLSLLAKWPTDRALRWACTLGLIALVMMVAAVFTGTPLPVVGSMALAQPIGVLACLILGLSIAADVARRR